MLKPNYFEGKADVVVKYYEELEDYLLRDIAKFLLKAGELGGKADRELFVLQQMGMENAEITKRLAELSGQTESAVKKVLQDSVMTSFSNDKSILEKYFKGDFGPLNNPTIVNVMDAEWVKTCGEMSNLTRTTMQAYNSYVVNLLDMAELEVATGNKSYSAAVIDVLDNFAKSGMVIDYPSGARRSLEAAVRCAVVTSMNQTAAQVTNQYIAEGGIEYVLVSAHTGARTSDKGGLYSHAGWQGKAYKIRGSEDGFPNLLESTGYDIDPVTGAGYVVNPNGLHGYNCRHSHQPWEKDLDNPWIDEQGKLKVDKYEKEYVEKKQSVIDQRIAQIESNESLSDAQKQRLIENEEKRRTTSKYEDTQTQRAMERAIRQTKREINMRVYELENLPKNAPERDSIEFYKAALKEKLTNRNKYYSQYCSDFGLTEQADRLKVAGYKNTKGTAMEREESKRNIHTELLVNEERLSVDKLRERLSVLGESEQTTIEIQRNIHKMLDHRNNTHFEDLAFIDSINEKAWINQNYDYYDEKNKISRCRPSEIMQQKINKAPAYSFIGIHNHPSSNSPSIADFNAARIRKYKYGLTVCHNGTIYKYSVDDRDFFSNVEKFNINVQLDKLKKSIDNKDEFKILSAIDSLKKYKINIEVLP